MYLHEKLEEYGKHGRYPMHMPGHKRQLHEEAYAGDITEIDGFDNLHHSEDVLKSDREKAAQFYGAGEARFLVNGSTCGVLAAISAVTEYGDSVIIGRNSHKSAYHAIQLRGLRAEYVYPDASLYEDWSIDGPILPDEVRRLLESSGEVCKECDSGKQSRRYRAVFLTSPTYEGVISDVREIANICHEHGVPLIVDEAHGAHLKVMEIYGDSAAEEKNFVVDDDYPSMEKVVSAANDGRSVTEKNVSAVDAGADLVILGLHKTMPVLTQGALLAVSREAIRQGRVSMKVLDEYLGIYETSSPSYVLMGSISRCVHWLDGSYEIEGRSIRECVTAYKRNLEETRRKLSSMKQLRLFPTGEKDGSESDCDIEINKSVSDPDSEKQRDKSENIFESEKKESGIMYDPGKIVISTKKTGLTGQWLADILREKYQMEIEMASADYVVAMTSMFDTEEGMKRFADAVLACDAMLDTEGCIYGVPEKKTKLKFDKFPRARAAMSIAEAVSFAGRYPEEVQEREVSSWIEKKDISETDGNMESKRIEEKIEEKEPERKKLEEKESEEEKLEEKEPEEEKLEEKEPEKEKLDEKEMEEERLKEKKRKGEGKEGDKRVLVSTEFIYVYPPGIPIVAPGEIITKGVAKKIICDYNSGCALIGCEEREGKLLVRCIPW